MNTQIVTTGLTLIVSLAWMATFIARLLHHSFEGSAAVDTAMLLMLGFWFGNKALKTGNGASSSEAAT